MLSRALGIEDSFETHFAAIEQHFRTAAQIEGGEAPPPPDFDAF